jgi:hypothetical protein
MKRRFAMRHIFQGWIILLSSIVTTSVDLLMAQGTLADYS